MRVAQLVSTGVQRNTRKVYQYKCIESMSIDIPEDEIPFEIKYLLISVSNDDKYLRTALLVCNEKGVVYDHIPPIAVIMGDQEPAYMLQLIHYEIMFNPNY